jgi:hypothetical protein
MKNIHVLPTDKPSRLRFFCGRLELMRLVPKKSDIIFQHIYITSDVEIKEGDWFIRDGSIHKCFRVHKTDIEFLTSIDSIYCGSNTFWNKEFCKKIILTTDQDLIKDGVQAIEDEFLEWFVQNPSCEYVEVSEDYFKPSNMVYGHNTEHYKIIIPKEPKPIHQQIIDIVGGEDRFREIANLKPKQETLKKVEENIDREEWIHFFKNNSKEEILEYLIKYKFPL